MSHKLMIKTHKQTGFKYLCYTQTDGDAYLQYKGSGKHWKRHLLKHGFDIETELIFESDDYEEFKKTAIEKSHQFNIVESDEWANIRIEEGTGGDTVSSKMWITDGITDKYLDRHLPIPSGWKKGRSKCVFNDSNKQKEFADRVDRNKNRESMKKSWARGDFDKRDNKNIGSKSAEAMKRPEVRQKLSEAAKKRWSDPEERKKASQRKKEYDERKRNNDRNNLSS